MANPNANYDDMDDIIDLMYLRYIYASIYIKQVSVIQRYYRYYRFKKSLAKLKHKFKINQCLEDMIELSYMPPTPEYLLLQNGGYHYREGLKSFNHCLQL